MKQKLFDLSYQFRSSIEQMGIEKFPQSLFFERFPQGCCGDTSDLLAKYLTEHNIYAEYVWGINSKGQSHGWLEYQGWIVDITADQFNEIQQSVLVTTDKAWHSKFKERGRGIRDFEQFNEYNKERLSLIYNYIKESMSTENS